MVLRVVMTQVAHLVMQMLSAVPIVSEVPQSLIVVIVMLLVALSSFSRVQFIVELPIMTVHILPAAIVHCLIGMVNLLEVLWVLEGFLLSDVLIVISIIVMVKGRLEVLFLLNMLFLEMIELVLEVLVLCVMVLVLHIVVSL